MPTCPSCMNKDEKLFVRFHGTFTIDTETDSGFYRTTNTVLLACKKCSCIMIDDWHCKQKNTVDDNPKRFIALETIWCVLGNKYSGKVANELIEEMQKREKKQ